MEGRFDVERMVDDYLALYQRVVELHRDGDRYRGRPLSSDRRRAPFRVGVNYWPARTGDGLVVELRPGGGCSRL